MTPESQNELRTIIREEVNEVVNAAKAELTETMGQKLNAGKAELTETMGQMLNAAKAELTETMRDMQTEMIRGMERFARGNFARMHRLEVSDNDLVERINALEERTLALETRLPPFNPPPA